MVSQWWGHHGLHQSAVKSAIWRGEKTTIVDDRERGLCGSELREEERVTERNLLGNKQLLLAITWQAACQLRTSLRNL